MRRATLQAVGVLVGVFALGAVAGGAGTYAYAMREQSALIGPGRHAGRMRGLERRLDLTREQGQQVEAIFAKHHETMERLKSDMLAGCGQALRAEVDAVDAEIAAVLTPQQQQEFARLREERDRRGLLAPPGPPPGGGFRGGRGHGGPPPR